jgi:hypothetical protein
MYASDCESTIAWLLWESTALSDKSAPDGGPSRIRVVVIGTSTVVVVSTWRGRVVVTGGRRLVSVLMTVLGLVGLDDERLVVAGSRGVVENHNLFKKLLLF